MILILDYGIGNLGSIHNMLKKIGVDSIVSSNHDDIKHSSKIILPGVGAFDLAMTELMRQNLLDPLNEAVFIKKKLILGICLGAQILGLASEEGELPGLGWIDMQIKRFTNKSLRVPHMGWNAVTPTKDSILFKKSSAEEMKFYFVHSYFMECKNKENIIAETMYGENFTCAVQKDNILGVQFHPEKSHKYGFQLLSNFANA
jgi:glutamine amidotransferase